MKNEKVQSVGAGLGINIDCCYQRFYKTRPDRGVGGI